MSDRPLAVIGIMAALSLILVISFSCGMVKNPWEYETDYLGNVWPAVCRQDLTGSKVPIAYMPREVMRAAANRDVNGLTFSFGTPGDEKIWIADDLRGWLKDAVIAHEHCHENRYGGLWWHM